MSDTLPIHFDREPDRAAQDILELRLGGRLAITSGPAPPEDARYRVLVGGRPTPELVNASEALTHLVVPWAGLPVAVAELGRARRDLTICNLHHNATATAELAVALLLAVAKNVPRFDRELRAPNWRHRGDHRRSVQLEGRTALIVGYGSIGRRVAATCRALGLEVLAVRRTVGEAALPEAVYGVESLPELLPRANVVVICCPATPDTEGLIGRDEFALMPNDTLLVNVARGSVVQEEALFDALRRREIRGAGIDVWYQYPTCTSEEMVTTPSRFPFHELSNLVMSPHRGGHVIETTELRMHALADTLQAIADGLAPPHRVDVDAGY